MERGCRSESIGQRSDGRNVAYPFLQGRCLSLAGRFAKLLLADVRGQYFEAAIQVIESNETEIPFKVSAVKSIQQFVSPPSLKRFHANFLRHSFAEYISDAELAVVPRIIRDLGPFLLETSEDTLSLVLETVSVLAAVGKGSWFTTDLAVALTTALLDVWPKNIKGLSYIFSTLLIALIRLVDPIFLSLLNDVLLSIAGSNVSGVYEATVKEALPRLTTSVGNYNANESWVASSALDLIGSLARAAPETGLGEGFFAAIAPNVFDCMRVAEDRDVLHVRIYSFLPVPCGLTWVSLERNFAPDARRAQGRWPASFMDAYRWPIGPLTRANLYRSPASEPRRVWWTRHWRPHHPSFPTRRGERTSRFAGPSPGHACTHADRADGNFPAEPDHSVRFSDLQSL